MKRSSVTVPAFGVAVAIAVLLPLSTHADQGSALACPGTWVAHGDSERPLFALKRDVAFEMQVRECGEAVMLHRIDNGEEVVLERTSRAPNTYVWTQAYAGRTIGWRLTQRAPNAMTLVFLGDGAVLDSSPMEYVRPLPRGTTALLAAECGRDADDAESHDPETAEGAQDLARGKQLFETVLSVVGQEVVETAGKPLRDYLTLVPRPDAEGQARVMLRVAHDGSLLPNPDTYSIDHTRCVVDEREYEPTGSFLYFTVFEQLDADPDSKPLSKTRVTRYADGTQTSSRQPLDIFYDTQLKQVDLKTREITAAQYASSSEPGDMRESVGAVVEAMQLGPFHLDDGFSN